MNRDNEDLFEYLAYQIVINYLEKTCLNLNDENQKPCWNVELEFPDCIDGPGRSKLHHIAKCFGLATHSVGKKSRRTFIYPKILHVDKQKQELEKQKKDRDKLREKFFKGDIKFNPDVLPLNTIGFIQNVHQELWYEKYKPEENKGPWYLADPNQIGKVPEDLDELKKLIMTKKKELETQTHNMQKL